MEISGYLYSALVSVISLLGTITVFKAGIQRAFQSRRTFSRWTARVLALCSRAPEHCGAFNLVSTCFMVVYGVWVCRLGGPYWSGLARWSPDVCPGLLSNGGEAHARTDCEHAAHLHPCADR